jgi:hypothetical protein
MAPAPLMIDTRVTIVVLFIALFTESVSLLLSSLTNTVGARDARFFLPRLQLLYATAALQYGSRSWREHPKEALYRASTASTVPV